MFSFERGLCPRNLSWGEVSEGGEAPSEFLAELGGGDVDEGGAAAFHRVGQVVGGGS